MQFLSPIQVFLNLCAVLPLVSADFSIYSGSCAVDGLPGDGGFGTGGMYTPSQDRCNDASQSTGYAPGDFFTGQNPCNREETLNFYPEGDGHVFYVAGGDGQIKGQCGIINRDFFTCSAATYSCLNIMEAYCITSYCV